MSWFSRIDWQKVMKGAGLLALLVLLVMLLKRVAKTIKQKIDLHEFFTSDTRHDGAPTRDPDDEDTTHVRSGGSS